MTKVQNLIDKRAAAWHEASAIMAKDETTAEEREQYDRILATVEDFTAQIERVEEHNARAAKFEQVVDRLGVVGGAAGEVVDDAGNTRADYDAAFALWARHGTGELSTDQRALLRGGALDDASLRQIRNAQGVGTGAAGGFTVPALFRDVLVERLKFFSGVRQVAESITTDTGADLPWMTNDDTANVGAILGENTQVTEQDLTVGASTLSAYMYTSKLVRVSLQLLQDSALDLNTFLPRKLGERIGRAQNAHFTTGTGTAQPLGLITGGTAVQAATGNVTGFSYDALVDATDRLDPAYLGGGNLRWMGSQAARTAIRKLKSTDGVPLWQPSLQEGTPDLFLGYGWILNNDVPVPAASAKSLAFGDFREGYVVRDVTGVQVMRLDERYADFLQVGFLGFQRAGGTVQNTAAYTVLQNSAT